MNPLQHPIPQGFKYLWRGFKLLGRKEIRLYVWLPALINILLYASLFILGIYPIKHLIAWMEGSIPHWLHWIAWLIWILFFLASMIIMVYTYTFIANLVAGPFNGLLAEKLEELLTGKPVSTDNAWRSMVKTIPYTIKQQLKLLLYYIPRALGFVVLFFIPVIHIIVVVLWFIFNAWTMAMQYLCYPMENHRIPLREIRRKMQAQRLLNLSFGTAVLLVSMVPIINLIVMPAAAIGATLIWMDCYRQEQIKHA
jgi:CysZ protein